MTKLIIGLTGRICSGKTTISEYLRNKRGAAEFRFSNILKDILKRLHMENKRTNLQALGAGIRDCMGPEVLLNAMIGDLEDNGYEIAVLDGVRYPNEVTMIHKLKGIVINVTAPEEVRHARAVSRGTRGEANMTIEQFRANEQEETEKHLDEMAEIADYTIENTGSFDDLYAEIEKIIEERMK